MSKIVVLLCNECALLQFSSGAGFIVKTEIKPSVVDVFAQYFREDYYFRNVKNGESVPV